MKDSTIIKILETAQDPIVQTVQGAVEKVGKTSAVAGTGLYTVEQVIEPTSLTQIGAIVSIIGGIVWIVSIIFGMFLNYLKYRRGDSE